MPVIPRRPVDVFPPATLAALLLASLPHLRALGLADVATAQVLAGLEVSKSRAYLLKSRLEGLLLTLVGTAGRPAKPPPAPAPPSLATEVLRYLAEHPGAYRRRTHRCAYSDGFRAFILELRQRHTDVPVDAFAEATTIPLGTLKDWLCDDEVPDPTTATTDEPERTRLNPTHPQVQTLLAEWERWDGGFVDFCGHVQHNCLLPFKRQLIATILKACGVRIPARRRGRSPDESALRDAFVTYFPHAQWVGDGTVIPIDVDGQLFVFNLELDVDAYSGAFLGAHISDFEDSDAVIQTFRDAIDETGARPLALLLDNKPSNHTDRVTEEIADDTLLIRATPFRPQNKAHVEGAFGLLKPTLDGLALDATGSRRDLARSFAAALVIAAGRAINHRPRRGRGGRSRVDLLSDAAPSEDAIEQAKQDLRALLDKQKKARETLAARQDPIVRERILAAFDRLGLLDPHGHFLTGIARYPLNAVVDGIAIFEAKQRAGTLPERADVRYMLGIIRNVADQQELWELGEALWVERTATRDSIANALQRQRADLDAAHPSRRGRLVSYVDQALATDARIERAFWLDAAARCITEASADQHEGLYRQAARRITAAYAVSARDRADAIRFLADRVMPLR